MPTIGPGLCMVMVILGILFIVGGIAIAAVIYFKAREWEKRIMPVFDMDFTPMVPESLKQLRELISWAMAFGKDMFGRIFNYVDIANLLGGASITIVGIVLLLIGIFLRRYLLP